MMRKNEILEEVWRNRDEFAKEHHYDISAIVAALQELEKRSPGKVVDRRRPRPDSDKAARN